MFSATNLPEPKLYPELLEGDLLLSHDLGRSEGVASSSVSVAGSYSTGVVWRVEALQVTNMMKWTVLPSTGLLRPGQR